MQGPDTHLVEMVGFGKYFNHGPEREEQWRCSAVVRGTSRHSSIGVVPWEGYRLDEWGRPEILVHEADDSGWRDEYWFQGEEAAVVFGALVIDGHRGTNCDDHEGCVEVWTCDHDSGEALTGDDFDTVRIVSVEGEVVDTDLTLKVALRDAGIVSEARLFPARGEDEDTSSDSSGCSAGEDLEDGAEGGLSGSCRSDGGSDSDVDGGGDDAGSAEDKGSGDDESGSSGSSNECAACGACWRIGEECRSDCEGVAGDTDSSDSLRDSEATEL